MLTLGKKNIEKVHGSNIVSTGTLKKTCAIELAGLW